MIWLIVGVIVWFVLVALFDVLAMFERAMSRPRISVKKETTVNVNPPPFPAPKSKKQRVREETERYREQCEALDETELDPKVIEEAKDEIKEDYAFKIDDILK